ncbi:MAG: Thermonuclease precursor [Pseudomonadota bacterium]|jgi:endonuclease YncB( thermonuclease family)
MKKFLTLLFVLLNLVVFGVSAETILDGRVVEVADGDTLTVLDAQKKTHKIRLLGIDAPEKAQAFGQKSKESLSGLAFQKQVQVRSSKKDRYGRTVGQVFVGNMDVCLEQVKLGMAWHYKTYQREQTPEDRVLYDRAESQAREQRVGLWQDPSPIEPSAFRRQK